MVGCVVCFDGEFAAGKADPQGCVGIGTGQGSASGDKAPARYPRLRTNRGHGVSIASRGLRCPAIMRRMYRGQPTLRQQISRW
ncbi:Uncharacterised protein [Mycobacteroides abscessus subsp. abscessus]|nr:Uncharacterised protein [Mycobacteroides abscessus subsp. abscessus]SHW99047.1 Uncharacterised protein [Mycobacteroides abscessus subsp. abscessus]SIB24487.1 Uncharacterised protein [Mycobacteroides abscessus subsp. abscessus]SKV65455.1 Uncharacterised protein [Mycobacteroides abscessus subsp. abscessus]